MYFKALHIISLVLVCFSVSAQNRHLTDAQRDEQINFIRHDTLSVTVEALPDEINSRFSEYSGKLSVLCNSVSFCSSLISIFPLVKTFFVSFPSTSYSGNENIDVSDVDNAINFAF